MAVNWFFVPETRPWHTLKLICLPYAGGSAAAYREWGRLLPEHVEIHAVQLPGRGWRLPEAPLRRIEDMADQVTSAIEVLDGPLALFGHSMGAWLGFEVARRLQAKGRLPDFLAVSGRQAPSIGPKLPPMSHLSDDVFVATLQSRYGGIPAPILADPELLRLLLPAIRADVEALESYEVQHRAPVGCPLIAVGGRSDPLITRSDLEAWKTETTHSFRLRTFEGEHFYLADRSSGLFGFLSELTTSEAPSNSRP